MQPSRRHIPFLSALLWLAVLMAACGGGSPAQRETPGETLVPREEEPTDTQAKPSEPTAQPPAIDVTEASTGEVPQELLDAVLDDLVKRLGTGREEIEIEETGAVTWRDGSLGCPQPGMIYTQALVPGYQIVLRVGDGTFDYRTSEGGHFVLCEGRLAPVSSPPVQVVEEVPVPTSPIVPTPSSAGLQSLIAEAKEDLAKRLDILTDQIDLVELSSVVWPDGALGCPEPGVAYTQVQVEGLLIRLRAGKRVYPYHSGGGTAPFLCEQAIEGAKPQ